MKNGNLQIYWDGYGFSGQTAGIFYHSLQLGLELLKLGVKPAVFVKEAVNEFSDFDTIPIKRNPAVKKILDSKIIWPNLVGLVLADKLKKESFLKAKNIFHGLSNINLPFIIPKKKISMVITVHDLIPLLVPKQVSYSYYKQFSFILPKVLKRADRIICVSNWTRNTVLERFSGIEEKCVVIPNGIEKSGDLKERKETANKKIKLLFISRFEPYKRLEHLVSVVRAYKENFVLNIVTDEKGRKYITSSAVELISSGAIKVFCNLKRKELFTLYSEADVYVHPSLFEGFCLPAAEALARGVPVVYQRGSGIDELVGEEVGCSLGIESGLDDWISAIETMHNRSKTADFLEKIKNHLAIKNGWKDSAKALKSLYDNV